MRWIKFSILLIVFSAPVFAEMSRVKFGGKITSNFVNRTGLRSSEGFMSGYNWIEAETELYNSDRIVFASGWSYEQASQGKLLINHFGIEYKSGQHIFSIGRSLNAAAITS